MADILTDYRLKELQKVVKEFTNDETTIMAVPGQIVNNGKPVDSVLVVIGHNKTMKKYDFIYRGLSSNFREWMKKRIDEIKNK